ncbi:MAG: KTSC domain-containing protein [Candidatus Binatia bacterium]
MDILILISLFAIASIAWFVRASRPLTGEEIERLARRRRVYALEEHWGFYTGQSRVSLAFKSSMNPGGSLYDLNVSVQEFPSLAAALLKGKKHEWVIFGFCNGGRVSAAWMNKGPDRESVSILVSVDSLMRVASQLGASMVLDLHNHPNPDPSRLSACRPSPQDRRHAEYYGPFFVARNIPYLAFVAERGRHFQYACWIPDQHIPLQSIRSDVSATNGTSRLVSFRLRREIKAPSRLATLLQDPNATENIGLIRVDSTVRSSQIPQISPLPRVQEKQWIPPTDPSGERQFNRVPVASSVIDEVGYDFQEQILEVVFNNGGVYRYFGVPEHEYEGLLSSASKGRYLNTQIINRGYAYKRMN